jgi:hypothetical protein
MPIPSGTRHGHFAGEGCGLYAWSAPELIERRYTLVSKRIQCWGVVEGWGRVVEHDKGFRALYMRPLALSPMFPIDVKLLGDVAAAYEIPLLGRETPSPVANPSTPYSQSFEEFLWVGK